MSDNTMQTNEVLQPWVPDEVLARVNRDAQERLDGRKAMHTSETDAELIRAQFADAAPMAAASICHIALHGINERTRLTAAQYVIERVIGPVGQDNGSIKDPVLELINDIMSKGE
jgi:hypothetical protein